MRVIAVAFVLVWSSGYVAAGLAVQDIAPLAITFWRFLSASILLGVVALLRGERWPRGHDLWSAAGIGVLIFGVQFGPLYYGIAKGVPAGTTALIVCSAPLLVAALSVPLGWERLTRLQWHGIGLGVAGVATSLVDRVGRPPHLVELAWTILGLLGLASGTMLQGRARIDAGRTAIVAVEVAAGAVVVGMLAPWAGSMRVPMTLSALAIMGWISIVTGAGAPLLMFVLLERRGALRTSSLLFVVPGITALGSWPILDAPLGFTSVAGLAAAGLGLNLALRSSPQSHESAATPEGRGDQQDGRPCLPHCKAEHEGSAGVLRLGRAVVVGSTARAGLPSFSTRAPQGAQRRRAT